MNRPDHKSFRPGEVCPDNGIHINVYGTLVLPLQGKREAFIFMVNRWNPANVIDGRYV